MNEYISSAERPIIPSRNDPSKAIIAIERWAEVDGCMKKTYKFMSVKVRNKFLTSLLEYEEEVGHNAEIRVDHDNISLSLITKNINRVTELDKEYCRFADLSFKDVMYNQA